MILAWMVVRPFLKILEHTTIQHEFVWTIVYGDGGVYLVLASPFTIHHCIMIALLGWDEVTLSLQISVDWL